MQAGFVCTATCGSNQMLNAATCSCVPRPTSGSGSSTSSGNASGSGGSGGLDAGQTNFGPPVITAYWPPYSLVATTTTTSVSLCGGALTSAFPIWLLVQNRGDTVPRLNDYATPTAYPTPSAHTAVGAAPMVPAAGKPAAPAVGVIPPGGATAYTAFSFASGGEMELIGANAPTNGYVGRVKTLSGIPGSPMPTPSPTLTPTPASQALWNWPGRGARDAYGNLYFIDSGIAGGSIRVICQDVTSPSDNPWCVGQTLGSVYKVAGGDPGDTVATWVTGAATLTPRFKRLTGIAVDQYANVFFTDTENHVVGIVCAGSAGQCGASPIVAAAPMKGRTFKLLGSGTAATSAGPTDFSSASSPYSAPLWYPLGIDIDSSTTPPNLYVTEAGPGYLAEPLIFPTPGPTPSVTPTPSPTPTPTLTPRQGRVRVFCAHNQIDVGGASPLGPCTAGTVPHTYVLYKNIDVPSDIKVNWNQNLFFTERGDVAKRGAVWAACYNSSGPTPVATPVAPSAGKVTDLCANATAVPSPVPSVLPSYVPAAVPTPKLVQLAGAGSGFGDSGDGGPASAAKVTLPNALLIAKAHGGDMLVDSRAVAGFRDNNLGFVELPYDGDGTAGSNSGNALRMICGQNLNPVNTDNFSLNQIETEGFCSQVAAGTLVRIAGKYGKVPAQTTANEGATGPETTFARIAGVTYDRYKNAAVSSQASIIRNLSSAVSYTWVYENSIKLVRRAALTTNTARVKYGFTDSNQQSSYYCLRLKLLTECYLSDGTRTCDCEPVPPYGTGRSFWEATTSSANCSD